MREQALATLDLDRVKKLESGVAEQIDTVITLDILGRTPRRNLATVRDHGPIMVFVTRQTHYPATFLGEVLTTRYGSTDPLKEIMVFRKEHSNDSWRLMLDADSETTTVDPAGMADVFDAPLPQFASVDPASLPTQLAAYWQSWWTTGHAPNSSAFAPGYWTTQRGALIAQAARGRLDPHCGCFATLHYQPDRRRQIYAFNTHAGGLLDCFAIEITDTSVPPPGTGLIQDVARNNWGAPLAPGVYRKIQMTTIRPACVYANPPQGLPLDVLTGDDGTNSVTGIPGCRFDSSRGTHVQSCLAPERPVQRKLVV